MKRYLCLIFFMLSFFINGEESNINRTTSYTEGIESKNTYLDSFKDVNPANGNFTLDELEKLEDSIENQIREIIEPYNYNILRIESLTYLSRLKINREKRLANNIESLERYFGELSEEERQGYVPCVKVEVDIATKHGKYKIKTDFIKMIKELKVKEGIGIDFIIYSCTSNDYLRKAFWQYRNNIASNRYFYNEFFEPESDNEGVFVSKSLIGEKWQEKKPTKNQLLYGKELYAKGEKKDGDEEKQKFLEEKISQVEKALQEKLYNINSEKIKFERDGNTIYIIEPEELYEKDITFVPKLIDILRDIDISSKDYEVGIKIMKLIAFTNMFGEEEYTDKSTWEYGNNRYHNSAEKKEYGFLTGSGINVVMKFDGKNRIELWNRNYDEVWTFSGNEKKILRTTKIEYGNIIPMVLKVAFERDGQLLYEYNYNENGEYNGQQLEYYDNGNLKLKAEYINGVPNGIQKSYYEDGSIKTEIEYKNGWLSGMKYLYSPEGNIISETRYIYDEKNETQTASGDVNFVKKFKDGKIYEYEVTLPDRGVVVVRNYLKGKMNGVQMVKTLEGKIISETKYKNGVRNGTDKKYYLNGKLKSTAKYSMGKPVGSSYEYTPEGKKIKTEVGTSEILVLNETAKRIVLSFQYIAVYLLFFGIIIILAYFKRKKREAVVVDSL